MGDLDDLKLKLAAAEARVAALEKQVAELLEKLNRNSKNSNKPPSTESPAERLQRQAREKQRTKDEAKKKRGSQPRHDGRPTHARIIPPSHGVDARSRTNDVRTPARTLCPTAPRSSSRRR